MKKLSDVLRLMFIGILACSLWTGCEGKGSAEKMGESLDKAGENIKDAAEDAGDEIKDAAEDAGDKIKDAVD